MLPDSEFLRSGILHSGLLRSGKVRGALLCIISSCSIVFVYWSRPCQNLKFLFDHFSTSMFCGVKPRGCCSDEKVAKHKMFSEFNCRGGLFYVKCQYFRPYPEIQLPIFPSPGSEVSKEVCHAPVGHKLAEEIDFWEIGHFQPRTIPWRPADLTSPPINYL